MANPNIQTAYPGEVLERLLVKATTGNELVSRGLIRVEPNVQKAFYLPRLHTGKFLQKRKEQPEDKDSKGEFKLDERKLDPVDFMAFTTFNPRAFEQYWRKWQPTGNLVFSELPPAAQAAFLEELGKVVDFELGFHFINGKAGDGEENFFNGILTRILADPDVITTDVSKETSMVGRLRTIRKSIPKALRSHPGLKILMSIEDFDTYDNELTDLHHKGADETTTNASRYKKIAIEALADMPQGVIVATIATMDVDSNLWAAVNLADDFDCVKIDRLTNAGERYFFKMLMKADTNTVFGEHVVLADWRADAAAQKQAAQAACGVTAGSGGGNTGEDDPDIEG